ncbi:hypothetical protein IU399_13800 [Salmonella enterica subsp. enterica serovar Worthington]|nr:hypothetical protein [Salmonella enterica subsp. enterica serovar Worthington]MBP1524275.1 hypothetical protein [Salmonella enterica subsp. enterica serovar Worthington]
MRCINMRWGSRKSKSERPGTAFIAIALILNQVIDVGKLMGALGGDSGPGLSFGLTLAISNA